jgi:hypothetical protein
MSSMPGDTDVPAIIASTDAKPARIVADDAAVGGGFITVTVCCGHIHRSPQRTSRR